MLNRDWMEYGSCVDLDVNLFFDDYEEREVIRENVNKLCSLCPVRDLCEIYGTDNKEWGVWGGKYLKNGKEVHV